MKDKPGNYGLLFRVLADAQDRYASTVIPNVTPPINNPEKKGNIHLFIFLFILSLYLTKLTNLQFVKKDKRD